MRTQPVVALCGTVSMTSVPSLGLLVRTRKLRTQDEAKVRLVVAGMTRGGSSGIGIMVLGDCGYDAVDYSD